MAHYTIWLRDVNIQPPILRTPPVALRHVSAEEETEAEPEIKGDIPGEEGNTEKRAQENHPEGREKIPLPPPETFSEREMARNNPPEKETK